MTSIAVIGAGAIGTAIAWRCAQRGCTVTLVDPDPSRGAWHTAAGMLAPISELHHTETMLLRLNLASHERFADYAAELADATGLPTGYLDCGTVEVGWDAADLQTMRELHELAASLGLKSELLSSTDLRRLEPSLAPGLPGGLLADHDHQVDPRLLHAAQLTAATNLGVEVIAADARLDLHSGRVRSVLLPDGTALSADLVVLAAGAWSAQLGQVAVRPVKGQTLRLRMRGTPRLRRVVRGTVRGTPIYIVPRSDGRVVLGASSDEAGFDQTPRAGVVYELLRDAVAVVPELAEAEFEEVCTGLRPGSADNAPLIGPVDGIDGLVVASGHFRNGILLTPVTADAIAQYVTEGTLPEVVQPFSPQRGGLA